MCWIDEIRLLEEEEKEGKEKTLQHVSFSHFNRREEEKKLLMTFLLLIECLAS